LKLLQIYKKLGEVLGVKKNKKVPPLKSLYGIWKGIKVDEEDFEKAKNPCSRPLKDLQIRRFTKTILVEIGH